MTKLFNRSFYRSIRNISLLTFQFCDTEQVYAVPFVGQSRQGEGSLIDYLDERQQRYTVVQKFAEALL